MWAVPGGPVWSPLWPPGFSVAQRLGSKVDVPDGPITGHGSLTAFGDPALSRPLPLQSQVCLGEVCVKWGYWYSIAENTSFAPFPHKRGDIVHQPFCAQLFSLLNHGRWGCHQCTPPALCVLHTFSLHPANRSGHESSGAFLSMPSQWIFKCGIAGPRSFTVRFFVPWQCQALLVHALLTAA